MQRILSLAILVPALLIGCRGQSQDDTALEEEHAHGGTSVTLWTENTELFMEYPSLVVGESAGFAVHLTNLRDFKPVTSGRLTTVFKKANGERVTVVAEAPSYPGIFRPVVTFEEAGVYDMELRLEGSQVEDIIHVSDVRVYANEAAIPHEEEPDSGEDLISFLKEQQWRIVFRTEPAQIRKLAASVKAVGEILPRTQSHAEVPALVNGIILADQNSDIPSVGTWVRKGDVLAVISPPADTESGITRIRNEYLLAKAEFERTQRLFEQQAIPKRRMDEAKLKYEARKASYDVIAQQVDFGFGQKHGEIAALYFHLKAPIDGVIEETHFRSGQTVQAGQGLFTITNPKRVWLKAQVPLARIGLIKNARDASFRVEGYTQEFSASQLNGRLISIGSIADKASRTVPVIFELDNPDNKLKINMFAEVSVKTGDVIETPAIPTDAVFDDNGIPVAYVQVEGEAFAKRVLQTGITDRGFTQILTGLAEGERVVTVGGYQVRLALLSTSLPTGHGHEH